MEVRSQIDPFLYRSFSRDNDLSNKLKNQKNITPKIPEHSNSFQNMLESKLEEVKTRQKTSIEQAPKNELYSRIGSSNFQLRLNREAVEKEISEDPGKKKIYDAAKGFEAFFLEKVFKEMKKSLIKEKLIDGGFAEEVFDEMLLTERIGQMSNQQEFGLAETIYHQMTR